MTSIDPFDIAALEKSLNDSAVRVSTIWVTLLIFGLYLVTATVNVTQRQLFLQSPIKLPLLNIDLPLVGFFLLAPILFFILHGYVLLQLVLLARTASVYNDAVDRTIACKADRIRMRQRLANTLFAQMFAGSSREREGLLGWLLKATAWVPLVFGAISILLVFDIKFLPYHSYLVTWTHRILIALDLLALALLWPAAIHPDSELRLRSLLDRRKQCLLSLTFLILVCAVLSFPDEIQANWSRYALVVRPLVTSDVKNPDFNSQQLACDRVSLFRTILPLNFDRFWLVGETFADEGRPTKLEARPLALDQNTSQGDLSLDFSGRNFRCGAFMRTNLQRANFSSTGMQGAQFDQANLQGAKFYDADLQGVSFEGAQIQGGNLNNARLQGALLFAARLQGAGLLEAELQGATMNSARLQGAFLDRAHLSGASLNNTLLQGASLFSADLQGASFVHAAAQGAIFKGAHLQGAYFYGTGLQGADFEHAELQGATFEAAQLQGAVFDDDSDLTLADFSNDFVLRATLNKCGGAQVSNPRFDPVLGLDNVLTPIQATPEGLERFLVLTTAGVPEGAKTRLEEAAHFVFNPEAKRKDTSNSWTDCAKMALPTNEYERQLATYLIEMTCNQADNAKYIAYGIIRPRIFGFLPKRPIAAVVARGLLGLNGTPCPGTTALDLDTKKKLQVFAGARTDRADEGEH